jgi:hypothetical protein
MVTEMLRESVEARGGSDMSAKKFAFKLGVLGVILAIGLLAVACSGGCDA